jgi:hypothetical protein
MALVGILVLSQTVSDGALLQVSEARPGALTIAELNLVPLQVTGASGIWSMSTSHFLLVMETANGPVVGIRLRGDLGEAGVYLGSVNGNRMLLTSLNGTITLDATISGTTMNGSLFQPGGTVHFNASRIVAPSGSRLDGIWATSLNSFLVYFSTDTLGKVVFDIALAGNQVVLDVFIGNLDIAQQYNSQFNGPSVFGNRSLHLSFHGNHSLAASYNATAAFSATSLLRFCASAADFDGDGVVDDCDVCPNDFDPAQTDTDGDGSGNACDVCAGDDSADADDNRIPDCLAPLGAFATVLGSYANDSSSGNCFRNGDTFALEAVPNAQLNLCDLPENPGCLPLLVHDINQASGAITFHGQSGRFIALERETVDSRALEVPADDDDDQDIEDLEEEVNNSPRLNLCADEASGPFAPTDQATCRYSVERIAGSCDAQIATMIVGQEICLRCNSASGECKDAPPGFYAVKRGPTAEIADCNVELRLLSSKCGPCLGLRAKRR